MWKTCVATLKKVNLSAVFALSTSAVVAVVLAVPMVAVTPSKVRADLDPDSLKRYEVVIPATQGNKGGKPIKSMTASFTVTAKNANAAMIAAEYDFVARYGNDWAIEYNKIVVVLL